MKIGIFTVLFNELKLEKVLEYVSKLGYECVELAAWKGSNHLNIDEVLSGGATKLKKTVEKYGLTISGLSNHLEGQLVLGPHDSSTDDFFKGTPEEKAKYGIERMKKTAEAAAALDVPVVNGFIGAPCWGAWYIFPPAYEKIYEKGFETFAERWNPIFDVFATHGIKFAHEVHPQEQAYNIETAEQAVKAVNSRKEFGFNFDPSHFVWQGIDPVIFIKKFGERIYHAHAKDAELVKEHVATSGVIPTGGWMRQGRGFRFRVVGWGDVDWKRIMTALLEVRYDYVLSYEHEDPVMSREDGCEKCIAHLKPLIIKAPLKQVWW
ncbi:MAG: sugar phosphate isomerase/epimerase [Candidatus Bathyarchaeia archaeon]|nr:sugar phosphate isomerase/epimerase [Candidatus Bathyarchaeota archaeon]